MDLGPNLWDPTFLTEATTNLIGETLDQVLMVDHRGVRAGQARVHIVLCLHRPVRLEKKVHFSSTKKYELTFKYERLLGRCHQCARLDHVGVVCPEAASDTVPNAVGLSMENGPSAPPIVFQANLPQALSFSLLSNLKFSELFGKERKGVVIQSIPEPSVSETSEPLRLTDVVRAREGKSKPGLKRSRHALGFEPHALLLEYLGLGLVEISVSIVGEHKRSRGHPYGSRIKPKEELSVCPSSPTSSVSALSDGASSLSSAGKSKDPMA